MRVVVLFFSLPTVSSELPFNVTINSPALAAAAG
jgi:hypothetical protein